MAAFVVAIATAFGTGIGQSLFSAADGTPSNSSAAVPSSDFFTVTMLAAATGAFLDYPSSGTAAVDAVALSPDGKTLVTGDADGIVHIYSVPDGKIRHTLYAAKDTGPIKALAFNPNGDTLVTAGADGDVRAYNGHFSGPHPELPMRILPRLRGAGAVNSLAFNHKNNGDTLVTAGADGVVRAYNGHFSGPHPELPVHILLKPPDAGAINAVAYNPKDDTLVTAGEDGVVREYDGSFRHANPVRVLQRPSLAGAIFAIAFNHKNNGDTLVTGGEDGVVRIYNGHLSGTKPASPLRSLRKLPGAINAIVFSPDDGTLIVGGARVAVREYDGHNDGEPDPVNTLPWREGARTIRAIAINKYVLVTAGSVN